MFERALTEPEAKKFGCFDIKKLFLIVMFVKK